jgi:hypothetical protein
MKKIKIWLAIALVFIAGFTGGVVVTRAVVRHWIQQVITNPDRLRALVEKRMKARLNLDAAQRQKVDEILARTQDQIAGLRQEFAPPFRNITSNTVAEVSAVLRPEQRERFRKLLEESRHLLQPR